MTYEHISHSSNIKPQTLNPLNTLKEINDANHIWCQVNTRLTKKVPCSRGSSLEAYQVGPLIPYLKDLMEKWGSKSLSQKVIMTSFMCPFLSSANDEHSIPKVGK